jgi:multiple sugar transport system ATP-binding protein
MATVTFDHMYKRYGDDVVAVNDLNLEIGDGEFICLVGPSGCGKTTALRCVAGLEDISDGRLLIGDRVVNNVAPKDRDIAMVFQSYALYPHMTVYDNLAFGLKLRKMDKGEIDRRVKEGAEILDLGRYLDRKPRALSGGQRQRVALGRAIVREPSVFLMDEPLSNLDAKLRVQTRAEIARLHQRLGTTTIYVTHDQVEAMTMGDSIAVMRDGILQQVGTPQELYDHPVNIFVAGFIGSPSMNFATAKAEGKDLVLGGVKLELAGEQAKAADSRADGANVLIGFRPEHLELANGTSTADSVSFPAKVDVVEYLGNEELIHAQAEGNEIVALLPSDKKVTPGQEVRLSVPMDKLHIFDPDSEQTLAG